MTLNNIGKLAIVFGLMAVLYLIIPSQTASACWDPTICGGNSTPAPSAPTPQPQPVVVQPVTAQPVPAPAAPQIQGGSCNGLGQQSDGSYCSMSCSTTGSPVKVVAGSCTPWGTGNPTPVGAPPPVHATPAGTPASPFHYQSNGVNISITPVAGLAIPAGGLAVAYVAAPAWQGGTYYGVVQASTAAYSLTTIGYIVPPVAVGAFVIYALSDASNIVWVPEGWTSNAPPVYQTEGTPASDAGGFQEEGQVSTDAWVESAPYTYQAPPPQDPCYLLQQALELALGRPLQPGSNIISTWSGVHPHPLFGTVIELMQWMAASCTMYELSVTTLPNGTQAWRLYWYH